MPSLANILKASENIIGDIAELGKAIHIEHRFIYGQAASNVAAVRNTKPVIFGFTPPEFPINFVPFSRTTEKADISDPFYDPTGAASGSDGGKVDVRATVDALPDSFYSALKAVAIRLKMNPEDLLAVCMRESGLNPSAHPPAPNEAYGLNQLTRDTAHYLGMDDATYDRFRYLSAEEQLPWVEKFFRKNAPGFKYSNATSIYLVNINPANKDKATNPNAVLYDGRGPRGSDGEPLRPGQPGYNEVVSTNQKNYDANKGLDKSGKMFISTQDASDFVNMTVNTSAYNEALKRLRAVPANLAPSSLPPGLTGNEKFSVNVMGSGNTNSGGKDALQFLGRNLQPADARRQRQTAILVAQINKQARIMRETPGLMMMINPSSFIMVHEPNVETFSTRVAVAVQSWLEKPIKITARGNSSAFYSFPSGREGGGLTHQNRINSLGYLNLMSLVAIYQNNGVIFNSDHENEGIPVFVTGLYLYYDGFLYLGSFDTMSISDAADQPFSLSYSFTFNVRFKIHVGEII